ncbi:O-antigen ligase [Leptospira ryugenii]|uniref:O-antigen ligase n=1 Tax=Leptospira ryugenii TaxID=1917863 RepID=A0A2P2DZ75_9LEPT|nr:O-antigen ligase family protein [Leptospira ryugenii]GBF49896.1 O-antigen ligase [Leptospira ryugenii]
MLYRAYVSLLTLSIISCAFSVSLSQLFLSITLFLYLFLPGKPKMNSAIFVSLVMFYAWQCTDVLYHFGRGGFAIESLKQLSKSEFKDILLLSAFFVVHGIKQEDQKRLHRSFQIFGYVILVTGLLASFSSIRLARLVSDLYQTSQTWPYQHHYGSLASIDYYVPIGLMNTHLTFGGLISFVYPFFLFQFFEAWKKNQNKMQIFAKGFSFFAITLVYFLNNARSAMIGTLLSIAIGLYILIFIEKAVSQKIVKRTLISISIFFLLLAALTYTSPSLQKAIKPLFGSEKHTDSGRTFIWDSSLPLIQENFTFGIGPGNYPREIERSRKQRELEHPNLAYFYEVTQRGHSHNDYFHLAVIFGIPAAIFYFCIGIQIVRSVLSTQIDLSIRYMCLGLVGFFLSGLLQCYFQDDEVLIVFFYFLGYLNLSVIQAKET